MSTSEKQVLIKKFFSQMLIILFLLVNTDCDQDEPEEPITTPLVELFPVDGFVDFTNMTNVQEQTLDFQDTAGSTVKTENLKWVMINDDRDLYIALEWTDDTHNSGYTFSGPTDFDGVQVLLDNDGNGTYETGEDKRIIISASVGAQYIDQHVSEGDETDLTGDGVGWLRYYEGTQKYQAEFLFPLNPDAQGEDADISDATRINILLYDHVESEKGTGNFAFLYPNMETAETGQNCGLNRLTRFRVWIYLTALKA